MAKYRLTKGSHSALIGGKEGKRVEYHAGVAGQDIIELTDEQAKLPHLRKRIEKFYGEEAASAGSRESPNRPSSQSARLDFKPDNESDEDTGENEDNDTTDTNLAAVLSGNVDQVLAYIADHEDDDETLEALKEAETADKKRKGVLDALNALLGE